MRRDVDVGAAVEQDRRFAAIGAAAAEALRATEYRRMRTQDVAALVRLENAPDRRSSGGARSVVWLYNEVRSRRVLVALGAAHAWLEYLDRVGVPSAADSRRGHDPAPAVPDPLELSRALDALASAIEHVVRFHQAQGFLLSQVARGIGDISTSEKSGRPRDGVGEQWPDSFWGRVAAAGYEGRCAVYADFLTSAIHRAARAVVPLDARRAGTQAAELSDLVFRGLVDSSVGSTERAAAGFAAYWFERELVFAAGGWVRDLYAAERAYGFELVRTADREQPPVGRREIAAILLETDTLHARAAREGEARWLAHARRAGLISGPGASGSAMLSSTAQGELSAATARTLCDTSSRYGLALLRYGDLVGAAEAFRVSRELATGRIAVLEPDRARSYEARADHNLAEVAIAEGDVERSVAACENAFKIRTELLDAAARAQDLGTPAGPEAAAARRRLLLTAELRVLVTARSGRPVEAVCAAQQLLWGQPEQQYRPEPATRLRATLGEALLEAGCPLEARHHLEAARLALVDRHGELFVGRFELDNLLRLARAALLLGDTESAAGYLPGEPVLVWCAENISFRAAARARGLRALCRSAAGRQQDALVLAEAARAELAASCSPADTALADLDLARAVIRYRLGEPETAHELLERLLADQRARHARTGPATAETLLWLARTTEAAGDRAGAAAFFADLAAAADTTLEATHPLLLEAGLDHAVRLVSEGEFGAAARLVEPVLDDRPLPHGRPAVELGHPLRARAARLAQTLGLRPARERLPWADED